MNELDLDHNFQSESRCSIYSEGSRDKHALKGLLAIYSALKWED